MWSPSFDSNCKWSDISYLIVKIREEFVSGSFFVLIDKRFSTVLDYIGVCEYVDFEESDLLQILGSIHCIVLQFLIIDILILSGHRHLL